MTKVTTKPNSLQPATELAVDLFDNWIDPIETEVRSRARGFIEELIHSMLHWHGRATDEARRPAMKQRPGSRAIATVAVRGR